MTDLTDLQAVGSLARKHLAAFTVTLEALSNPHYQFTPCVGHLRSALFLLQETLATVSHAVAHEARRTAAKGNEGRRPSLPDEHAGAQTAQEPAGATNAPPAAVPVEPAPVPPAAAAPGGDCRLCVAPAGAPCPSAPDYPKECRRKPWDEAEVAHRAEIALMETAGDLRERVSAAVEVLLHALPPTRTTGDYYDNQGRKAAVYRRLLKTDAALGDDNIRRQLQVMLDHAEYVGD